MKSVLLYAPQVMCYNNLNYLTGNVRAPARRLSASLLAEAVKFLLSKPK